MALSFSERRRLQGTVETQIETLDAGGLAFAARRAAQNGLEDALDQLDAGNDPVVDPQPPEPEVAPDPEPTTPQNQKLTDLLSGKYDDLPPEAYLKVVQDVITEINAVNPVKPALLSYLDKAKAKGLITESAAAAFEAILSK